MNKRRVFILHSLAERDGGWWCHYCRKPLVPPGQESSICDRIQQGDWAYWDIPLEYEWPLIEHVIPKAKGGTDLLENLVLACGWCNCKKGAKSYSDFVGAS